MTKGTKSGGLIDALMFVFIGRRGSEKMPHAPWHYVKKLVLRKQASPNAASPNAHFLNGTKILIDSGLITQNGFDISVYMYRVFSVCRFLRTRVHEMGRHQSSQAHTLGN